MEFWRRPAVRWSGLLGGAILLRLVFFIGPLASDDAAYSNHAYAMVTGSFHPIPDIFSTRIGFLASIAAAYALFGAGPFTLVLTNLLFSIAGLILAYRTARHFTDDAGAWRAVSLLALFPLDVFISTEAHTDLPLAVLLTAAVLLYLNAKMRDGIALFVLAGATLGIAHLFKESAFFGFVALWAVGGRPKIRDSWAVAGFLGVIVLESIFYAAATGDALYRVHTVNATQSRDIAHLHTPGVSSAGVILGSVTQFFNPLSVGFPFFGLLPALAFIAAVLAIRRKDPMLRPLTYWLIAVLLLLILWPINFAPYQPALRPHARIFLIVEVPMAILAAGLLGQMAPRRAVLLFAAFAVTSITCSALLHSDARRMSAGARMAFDGPLHSEGGAVSDPRTTYLLRLYDGNRGDRTWSDWNASSGPPLRIVNETWIQLLKEWNGLGPPPGFEHPGVAPSTTLRVEGRIRLSPLLRGRVERTPSQEVRIYRIP